MGFLIMGIDPTSAAVDNLIVHAGWVQRHTSGMQVIDTEDYVLIDSGLPCDTFNLICRARLKPETARQQIRKVVGYFSDVSRPFAWWLSPGDQPSDLADMLHAAGLRQAETEAAMVADLAYLRQPKLSPEGLAIRRVRSANVLQDFAHIMAANWTPPDPEVLRFYELAAPVLLNDEAPLWLYVGYLGETPVATAELAVGGGVVGLYNICTLMEYRRRGIGMALTVQPLLDARAQGYQRAVLQAAAMGLRIYQRLGFETFGSITEFKPLAR